MNLQWPFYRIPPGVRRKSPSQSYEIGAIWHSNFLATCPQSRYLMRGKLTLRDPKHERWQKWHTF